MSYPVYGRYQVASPPSELLELHLHDGTTPLKTVDHETPLGVLDQSDLVEQGIHCTRFIPGCKTDPDALGSCTAETWIEDMAKKLGLTAYLALCKQIINSTVAEHPTGYSDVVGAQRAAIAFYYRCTHQTGTPPEEWPPTDCGSSGVYIAKESATLKATSKQKIATAGESLLSLLQLEGVLMGSPWFYAWEEPDAQGFIDGAGKTSDLEAAIQSGVAGGHETRLGAIEKITLLPTGHVDLVNTVIRGRNHWTKGWGDHGCYRVHASTLVWLNAQCDFRQLVV